jgi:hypothetical protein
MLMEKKEILRLYDAIVSVLLESKGGQIVVSLVFFTVQVSEKSGTNGNFIYYLHYMLYMFTPTLYAFSQPLYDVCADFA